MNIRNVFCVLALTLFFGGNVRADMQQRVERLLRENDYHNGGIGIMILDLETDSVVVSVDADSLMNPASVNKLFTGAAAMELFGPIHTFPTKVYIDGNFDSESGIVDGNLYIKGGADPGLSAERLWLFVQHLSHRGIKSVTGDLILDNSYFDSVSLGPGYTQGPNSRAYLPLISPLAANFSSIAIHHRSGHTPGTPVKVDVFPRIEGLVINSSARTAAPGSRGSLNVTTSYNGGRTQVNVSGLMPLNQLPGYTYRRVWQTWEVFGGAMRAMFSENGIEIKGETIEGTVSDSLINSGPFFTFRSQPVTEFVDHMFKYSSNFASEMLFKALAAEYVSVPGTWEGGAKVISDWWKNRKLPGMPVIKNGSGMGDVNRVSAAQVTELLRYVSQQKTYYPEFLGALSIGNVDGTLKDRFRQSRLGGLVRAKTGTLNSLRVSTLAGYLFLSDRTYAFAILCNNVGSGQFDNWVIQELILDTVASDIWW
ncbi:D-alanyl-D-alanine carboxypeptidase [Chitinispirillum alkaliphilum]|nr:D-alanyl-D-alanine carboxypeptidase [Chitinispirillum alkaliphilum]